MPNLDLNRLRDQLERSRARGVTNPPEGKGSLYVNPAGRIQLETPDQPPRDLAVIRPDVFSSGPSGPLEASRVKTEMETVERRFPSNTRRVTFDGVPGWSYSIVAELGRTFDFFAYFGGKYVVMCVNPKVDLSDTGHKTHIMPSGSLCLAPPQAWPKTLEEAYARSVLWATGFDIYLETGVFPF